MLLNHAGACGNANNGHTWHIFLRQIGIARGIETLKKVAVRTAQLQEPAVFAGIDVAHEVQLLLYLFSQYTITNSLPRPSLTTGW
jgi:hypothetical protein